ncbi:MAG: response regulator transcription factor [Candidatus Limnocylindrales bacterium]
MSTVLIVDDHPSFRLQARALLEAAGYVVAGEAADGRAAIGLTGSLRPDIVLLDIGLPDIGGFEVARQLAETNAPPVVVLTSSRDATSYGPLIAASPAAGFIAKDELTGRALAELVGRGRLRPGERRPAGQPLPRVERP